jgi:hypothetical protein
MNEVDEVETEGDLIDALNALPVAETVHGLSLDDFDDEPDDVALYVSPEQIAELIESYLDGIYDEELDVNISAGSERHSVRIQVSNEAEGFRKNFLAFVRVDNSE